MTAVSLAAVVLVAGAVPAQAAFPTDKSARFTIKNLHTGTCLTIGNQGSGRYPERRALRLRNCAAGARNQQWTRDPATQHIVSVSQPDQEINRSNGSPTASVDTRPVSEGTGAPFRENGGRIVADFYDHRTGFLTPRPGGGTVYLEKRELTGRFWETTTVQ
ncbi:RICIN domain-containing protein [Streptomyces microflavus]|uniref:RICIN domain-containing protein n=1 Tax=Streptomyces microflavus TaxID=1919 RepID=A0A7H8MY62_STRMI|nr:RICIN domain-containing protein [Streptomyces microflavus]QKW47140.1 RICIN domain-containing protein [Streptomyces microflavus]